MTPHDYIASEKLTWAAWADRLGWSVSHLHEICSGKKAGSAERLFQIEDDTDGQVTARELRDIRQGYLDAEETNGKAA